MAELQFTSGTTGEPKGVMHTPNTIFAGTRAFADTAGLSADDSVLMPSTLVHQAGFLVGIVLPLSMGMKVIYKDVWDPEVFCRLADECAGAPIPSPLVEAARSLAVDDLIAVWGMTENGAVTMTPPGAPVDEVADSDGVPVAWMEVLIVDEAGAEVAVGDVGRLMARGASQTVGYFKRPDLYQAQLMHDPAGGEDWFDTGDLARRRPDGGVRIAGRTKDLVIRGVRTFPSSR